MFFRIFLHRQNPDHFFAPVACGARLQAGYGNGVSGVTASLSRFRSCHQAATTAERSWDQKPSDLERDGLAIRNPAAEEVSPW
jgi:hypothetical protein